MPQGTSVQANGPYKPEERNRNFQKLKDVLDQSGVAQGFSQGEGGQQTIPPGQMKALLGAMASRDPEALAQMLEKMDISPEEFVAMILERDESEGLTFDVDEAKLSTAMETIKSDDSQAKKLGQTLAAADTGAGGVEAQTPSPPGEEAPTPPVPLTQIATAGDMPSPVREIPPLVPAPAITTPPPTPAEATPEPPEPPAEVTAMSTGEETMAAPPGPGARETEVTTATPSALDLNAPATPPGAQPTDISKQLSLLSDMLSGVSGVGEPAYNAIGTPSAPSGAGQVDQSLLLRALAQKQQAAPLRLGDALALRR